MTSAAPAPTHMRYLERHGHLTSTFGDDPFGRFAERFARAFGTPKFLVAQTGLVLIWLVLNAADVAHFDPYPFILLNLAFSTQAAYAAPMILLAQTRQSERDRHWTEANAQHREEISDAILTLLRQNTDLTQQIEGLTREVRDHVMTSR